jgi:hypothetical protein
LLIAEQGKDIADPVFYNRLVAAGSSKGQKALFFPLCAFFRSNSWAILPKKAFKWKENSTFFPLR